MKLVQDYFYSFTISDKKDKDNKKYNITFYTQSKYEKELINFIKMLDSIKLVKDLGNEPANTLNPTEFVKRIKIRGKKNGFKVNVLEQKQLKKMGMNSLLSVSEGSKYPGYLVELHLNNNQNNVKIVKKILTVKVKKMLEVKVKKIILIVNQKRNQKK